MPPVASMFTVRDALTRGGFVVVVAHRGALSASSSTSPDTRQDRRSRQTISNGGH
jgi:hypothetical protein